MPKNDKNLYRGAAYDVRNQIISIYQLQEIVLDIIVEEYIKNHPEETETANCARKKIYAVLNSELSRLQKYECKLVSLFEKTV